MSARRAGKVRPGPVRTALLSLGASLLCACAAVGPDFSRPEAPAAAGWSEPPGQGLAAAPAELSDWWRVFDDPVLDALVEEALRRNNPLEIAALQVLEARAALGIATGSRFPQTQVAAGDATYRSPPDRSILDPDWSYSLGATVAWEIDFWGRYRRAIESADAAYLASVAAHEQAQVLLTSAVVQAYTVIRTLEEQQRIARENIALQQRSYEIAEVLFRNGQDSELDVQQARTLLLATQATLPQIEADLRQARNALSLLLGDLPGSVATHLAAGSGIPALPPTLDIGFPADMLRRRPDLREAELLAMAQNAQVGLAEADLYPSFSLTGSIGLSAGGPGGGDFGDLFDGDAFSWSAGPSFVWPFLNYGRIRNNVRVQDARLQQALVAFRDTALQAAREAEDAMAAYEGAVAQASILVETVASARRSNDLATLRYSEGYSDYQRVLDAQQALFSQQQRLVSARGAAVGAVVTLFQALGGGWTDVGAQPWIDPETRALMTDRTHWGEFLDSAGGSPEREE